MNESSIGKFSNCCLNRKINGDDTHITVHTNITTETREPLTGTITTCNTAGMFTILFILRTLFAAIFIYMIGWVNY